MADVKNGIKEYPLSRDLSDFNRLNLQHYLWKDIFGYALHPKVPRDQKSLKVADVGTGTGIWLLDMASQLDDDSAEFVGIDTDVTQVGPAEWLPQNLSIRQWSVFTDVPEDLVGKFDIVNIRLFCWVIETNPAAILQKLTKLLKPGGYLQWCELDMESMRIETISPDVPTNSLETLWAQAIPNDSLMVPTWVKELPRMFEDEGLVGVTADWQIGKRHTCLSIHWCNLPTLKMVADKLRPVNPEKASEIDELVDMAFLQSRKGAMFQYKRVVVIGQKPEK
ncbi:hypothetical protein JX265_003266 [Neoarthrinium moseri]|uniref:Methyltransferase domain-containing protein n=1 Tax=Neoarthrinium moseri TaxID=1658444 RepID=A0A9P9WTL0_9PEZI|nr:hypothetical protein JX265_003266 [Neoarthrinium moseri]